MKKDLTEIIFILDRSGSMAGLENDTIGGFNSLIEKHKRVVGSALVSTILFDDKQEILHDRININQIAPMTKHQYYVRGSTALLDAIGDAIKHIKYIHKYTRKKDIPENTIFIITTDGMENASIKYQYDDIKEMIKYQKDACNWEFIFIGANIDAIKEASKFGIDASRAATRSNNAKGTKTEYEAMSEVIRQVREDKSIDINWKSNIDDDSNSR